MCCRERSAGHAFSLATFHTKCGSFYGKRCEKNFFTDLEMTSAPGGLFAAASSIVSVTSKKTHF